MSDEIPPALTPEQWAQVPSYLGTYPFDGVKLGEGGEEWVMALANAALPDGDPRKITRADVEALHRAVGDLQWHDRESAAVSALAAKLAALLPPE